MADVARPQTSLPDLGGMHHENHKLVPDTYHRTVRHCEQRSSTAEPLQGTPNGSEGPRNGQSPTESTNGGDEEDGSGQTDGHEDEEEEKPAVKAPSHGYGKGKGKRPAIRIEAAGDDESQSDSDGTTSREAGLTISKHPVAQLMNHTKKRTFSNTSLLFDEEPTFPRPKVARTLSVSDGTDLLRYMPKEEDHDTDVELAIASSDDERDPNFELEEQQGTEDDDEDYSALNQIMDDDSDVEKVEEEEENFIINDELQHAKSLFSTDFNNARRLSMDSFGSDDLFDLGDNESVLFASASMPDVGFGEFFQPEPEQSSPEPIAKRKFSDSSAKRVRFDDEVHISDSSSSSESELDTTLFPDLFMEQNKLPRNIYQYLVQETEDESEDEDFHSSASESFFNTGHATRSRPSHALKNDHWQKDYGLPSSDDEAGSSGYETDHGDTTDCDSDGEDLGPTPETPKSKTILSRPASAPGSRAATPKPFQRSAPGPTRGIFVHDDSKQAIAVTDRRTKKLTFFRPRAPEMVPFAGNNSSSGSTANNSPRTSLQQLEISEHDFAFESMMYTDPMFTGFNHVYVGAMGPPEAFFPFISIGENGNVATDEDEYDDELEFENDVNLADFMNLDSDFDETDVEQEAGDETDVPATPATSMVAINGSTPAQPNLVAETPSARNRSSTDAMLERLDLAGVAAFRNNQIRFRDMASKPHDPNLRASVSRPVRSGRSAEAMMSPLRKRGMPKKHGVSAFSRVKSNSSRLKSSPYNPFN